MYTWSFAYNIDAIRDWLFAQKKAENQMTMRGNHDRMKAKKEEITSFKGGFSSWMPFSNA